MRITRVYYFLFLLYLLATLSICTKHNPMTILKVSCSIYSLYVSRGSDTRNSEIVHSLWWSDEPCVRKWYLSICILSRINDKCMHYQKAMFNQHIEPTMTINRMCVCSYKHGGKIDNTDFPKVNAAVKIRFYPKVIPNVAKNLRIKFSIPRFRNLGTLILLGEMNFATNHACLTVFIPISDISLK